MAVQLKLYAIETIYAVKPDKICPPFRKNLKKILLSSQLIISGRILFQERSELSVFRTFSDVLITPDDSGDCSRGLSEGRFTCPLFRRCGASEAREAGPTLYASGPGWGRMRHV